MGIYPWVSGNLDRDYPYSLIPNNFINNHMKIWKVGMLNLQKARSDFKVINDYEDLVFSKTKYIFSSHNEYNKTSFKGDEFKVLH